MKTFHYFNYDGEAALNSLLRASEYGSMLQTVASLTLFCHPDTVKQTGNKALFKIRRRCKGETRGQSIPEESVIVCDNLSPIQAILWTHHENQFHFKEAQFNHIYRMSDDPAYFTSLANICITPAFLGKLTDKNTSVKDLLRYRAFKIYNGFYPGEKTPKKPDSYDQLQWAPYLPPIANVKENLLARIKRNPKSRIAKSIREYGWHFEPKESQQSNNDIF